MNLKKLSEPEVKFVRVTGAPSRFARMGIDDLDRHEGNAEAVDRVESLGKSLIAGDDGPFSVVLVGAFGTGKTRLAVWLLRNAYEAETGERTSTLDFPRFFRAVDVSSLRFGRSYSAPEDDEDRRDLDRIALERSPFVVIDDVRRTSGYRGEDLHLESVVEKRYDDELSTVLTMNELPTEGRFADFLRYFDVLAFRGDSHRG